MAAASVLRRMRGWPGRKLLAAVLAISISRGASDASDASVPVVPVVVGDAVGVTVPVAVAVPVPLGATLISTTWSSSLSSCVSPGNFPWRRGWMLAIGAVFDSRTLRSMMSISGVLTLAAKQRL